MKKTDGDIYSFIKQVSKQVISKTLEKKNINVTIKGDVHDV
jgi:hypothetical protein